jgi:hypothetical protein
MNIHKTISPSIVFVKKNPLVRIPLVDCFVIFAVPPPKKLLTKASKNVTRVNGSTFARVKLVGRRRKSMGNVAVVLVGVDLVFEASFLSVGPYKILHESE